ncbi:DNA-processing protein DprA [Arenibaculum sp.]|uniref:DNA-processing protein DprA n=1 Tax=Arenibaculum sp. TaxID=2865862 RepID=UPI002E151E45|nr:DNA-processing protein DprA [Arenibaculum sp.]
MPQPTRALSTQERTDWLRLIRSENVGPVTFFRLIERYGSAAAALRALPELAARGGRSKPLRICSRAEAERETAAVERIGARLLAACEPEFPPLLAHADDCPPVLCVLGHAHLLARPTVAIVGARNASLNGRKLAERIARDLGEAGYLVASGMARGIDAAAHAGALAAGTVAVVAGGADVFYPEENRDLQLRVGAEGAVVAEMPVGMQPQARHFPRRNRIIAGLSLGVLVVEAALKSGSLITARIAADLGREVFAVPGSPLDPRCHGTNALLREGAWLTEGAQDVLGVLAARPGPRLAEPSRATPSAPPPAEPPEAELGPARRRILECLSPTPVQVDELIRGCQLSPAVVQTVILELELAGRVSRHPGNQVCLV